VFATCSGRALSQPNVPRALRKAQQRATDEHGEPTFPVLHQEAEVPARAVPSMHSFRHNKKRRRADAGTRTPDPFITSEERRFRMFAAGSLFACSRADWPRYCAPRLRLYPDVPLPTHCPRRHPPARSGSRRAGGSLWLQSWRLHVIAHAVARRACAPTQASSRTLLPCVWRTVRGRPGGRAGASARSTRRTIRAAELATSARAKTWPETGQAHSGVDRPACVGCATLPEVNRARGPARRRRRSRAGLV
jgi:hypothetical protein